MELRKEWFESKFRLLKKFFYLGLAGVVGLIVCLSTGLENFVVIPIFMLVPLIFWLAFIPVLHWKDRYKGSHTNVWGCFLVFETSGWSKILYWFMHVLPDRNRSGQYRDEE